MQPATTVRARATAGARRALAAVTAAICVGVLSPTASTPAGAAAPSCRPASAPTVVGVDRTTVTVTVPKCSSPSGVTGYRVQALDRTGSTVRRHVDVTPAHGQATITGANGGDVHRFRVLARNADGLGPASTASPVTVHPFTTVDAFTDRQHRDLAGRASTAAERSSWATRIGNGTLTPVAAIDGLAQGTHWQRQSPVIRLYQAYFLRRPDLAGLDYWTNRHRSGLGLAAMSQGFANSPEFRERYGTLTHRQFVARIYQNILGRPGEAAGISYWTAELTSGRRTRGAVMIGFSESPEYKTRTAGSTNVINLFTGLIRRVPTPTELTTWQGRTRADIIIFLLRSSAYANRVRVTPPVPLGVRRLDATGIGGCVLRTDGRIVCWGWGPGTLPPQSRPTTIATATDAVDITIGYGHICVLTTSARVRCWGSNDDGQLGDGTRTNRTAPGVDPGLADVVEVSAGGRHTCARLRSGQIRCWGYGIAGQIGDGSPVTTARLRPTAVSGITNAVALSAGNLHTCVLLPGGQGRCWGNNDGGELGNGTYRDSNAPVVVQGLSGAVEISAGHGATCARMSNSTLRCWGPGLSGQGIAGTSVPVTVAGISTATQVTTGGGHECAVLANGTLRCWGYRQWGQLGDGLRDPAHQAQPIIVGGQTGVTQVSVGFDHSCALIGTTQVRCWGHNNFGQVGDGTTTVRTRPVTVLTL